MAKGHTSVQLIKETTQYTSEVFQNIPIVLYKMVKTTKL